MVAPADTHCANAFLPIQVARDCKAVHHFHHIDASFSRHVLRPRCALLCHLSSNRRLHNFANFSFTLGMTCERITETEKMDSTWCPCRK